MSGWLLEGSNLNDPRYGEGISQVFIIARYYPLRESNIFFKVGGGYVEKWNNRVYEQTGMNGWGGIVGCGYEFYIT